MPAIDEDVKMTGLVSRPDQFQVAEIPESAQSVVEGIQPALLIGTGYRPSDLLLEEFALIAIRVILECQHHMPAIDDPLQRRRSDVLGATLFAKSQCVCKIRKPFL